MLRWVTRTLSLVLVLGMGLSFGTRAAHAEGRDSEGSTASRALKRLASPVLEVRLAATQRLIGLLPAARPAVIKALQGSTWSVQVQLLEVLGQDGSDEALRALLAHLVRADEAQAVRIRRSLLIDVGASTRLLASWRVDPKAFFAAAGTAGKGRLEALVQLLRRAEIEANFLSRKSKSGSTGYYKGQYDLLKGAGLEPGYRALALKVVTGIAVDRAIRTPGHYRTGVYRFLRAHYVDEWEFRSMALNAVSELCTPKNVRVVEELERERLRLFLKRETLKERFAEVANRYSWDSKEYDDAKLDWEDSLGAYLDQLACLYLIEPARFDGEVRIFVRELQRRSWPAPRLASSLVAALQIRCGWYQEAIQSYAMAMGRGSKAFGYYNQACAFASWSQMVGLSERQKRQKLDMALQCLQLSVHHGWSDISWMNEDRDLDPIRTARRSAYDALVKAIKLKYDLK
jgi:hypothetical protein